LSLFVLFFVGLSALRFLLPSSKIK
jgi:hypothetical protein